jgi:hypothetical protein
MINTSVNPYAVQRNILEKVLPLNLGKGINDVYS